MSQTTVSQYGAAAFMGMLADISHNDILSYAAEGAVAIGRTVRLGTNKEKQVIQSGTGVGQGALVVGFSVHDHAREQSSAGLVQFADKETVNVLKRGRIWVETNDAVVAGTVANLHLATGKFTDEAVGAGIEAITQVAVRFVTGTSGAGLAVVEIK
jgi:hypothetical protein